MLRALNSSFVSRLQLVPVVNRWSPDSVNRLARRFVGLVWLALFALLIVYVAKTSARVPVLDEYFNVPLLIHPFHSFQDYWAQHNEHRIPLPRVLYVAAFHLGGNDFRAPPYLNVLLLSVAAAILVRAIAAARGRWSFTDAFIPMLVMGLGQHDNLAWGFQVQFGSSAALILFFLAVAIHPRFAESPWRIGLAGLFALCEPLCGANGVALCPALSGFLLWLGVRNLLDKDSPSRRPGLTALLLGLAACAMVPLYFHGLQSCARHEMTHDLGVLAANAFNFLGVGFGAVTYLIHGYNPSGISKVALGVGLLLIPTAALLAGAARTSQHRATAFAIGAVLAAEACLALGLAYGRGAMGGTLLVNRYSTLAMPILAAIYTCWAVLPMSGTGRRWGRVVNSAFLVAALASLAPNARQAFVVGAIFQEVRSRTEAEIRAGIPVTFVVDRHYPPFMRGGYVPSFLWLRDLGVSPFDRLALDPPMIETPIPLRVARSEGMALVDGRWIVTGDAGFVVLALPRREHIFGLKLEYEAGPELQGRILNLLTWEPGGTLPPRPGYGTIDQLVETKEGPAPTHIYLNCETDSLRIDLLRAGTGIRLHKLSLLKVEATKHAP